MIRGDETRGTASTRFREMCINEIFQFSLQLCKVLSCEEVFEGFVFKGIGHVGKRVISNEFGCLSNERIMSSYVLQIKFI